MKKTLSIFFFFLAFTAFSQESTDPNRGTIKVQKKGTLHSVLYDNVNFRLVCKDVYGNILDSAVVAFDLDFTVKGIAYSDKVIGNTISNTLQQRLGRQDGQVTLMFSGIKAKEKDGTVIAFPNFKVITGQAREQFDN